MHTNQDKKSKIYRLQRFYHMSIGCSMALTDFVFAEHTEVLTNMNINRKVAGPASLSVPIHNFLGFSHLD